MNLTLHDHPSRADLAAYGLGKLDDRRTQQVEEHLGQCPDCARTLKGLPDDSLVALLRESGDPAATGAATAGGETTALPPRDQATLPPGGDTKVSRPERTTKFDAPRELVDHPRYHILEQLGGGGMGQVFKAQHRIMNRLVALKIINPELMNHPGAVGRFHREIQAASRLLHPNIVTAYDADHAGELHFFVMEYVEGVDLHRLVQDHGPLPVGEACEYIRQAAAGLQHAHEQGMVHRDIKPHNLMLAGLRNADCGLRNEKHASPSAIVKILDFGLANFASETAVEDVEEQDPAHPAPAAEALRQLTQMGTMMGTPDYIAPEQAVDAHAADIRADIYSLGCTLYTLLSGRAPFGEGSVIEKIRAHTEQDPPPLSAWRADVPPEVEQIVKTMMAKDPADRYQTPAEVVAALQRFIDQRIDEKLRECDLPPPPPAKPMATGDDDVSRWYSVTAETMRWGVALPNILLSVFFVGLIAWQESRGAPELAKLGHYPVKLLAVWSLIPGMLLLSLVPKVRRMAGYGWILLAALLCMVPAVAWLPGFPLGCLLLWSLWQPKYREPLGLRPQPSFWDGLAALTVLLTPLALVAAGVVIYIEMCKATLKFEIEDPTITVRYEGKTITVENDGEPIRIRRLGQHRFSVERDGFQVRTENFELKRGDRVALRVTALDGRPQIIAAGPYRRQRQKGSHDSEQRMAQSGVKPLPEWERDLRDRLQTLVDAVRDGFDLKELNDWIETESPLLAVQPPPLPRLALEWLAELPASEHERLLRDGYLKWDPSQLGPKRDTAETLLQLLLFRKQGMSPSSRDIAESAPAQAVAHLLNNSDVGFTVVEVPNSGDAFISWCVIPRRDELLPIGIPLLGVRERHAPVLQFAQNQRYRELRDKPASPLPQRVRPGAASGDLPALTEEVRLEGHEDYVLGLDYTPDGLHLVSGGAHHVFVWNARNGRRVRELVGHDRAVHALAISPDGTQVVSAGKGNAIILFDFATGKEIRRFTGHTGFVECVAFSPDGRRIASGSSNWVRKERGDVTVRMWDVATGRELWKAEVPLADHGGMVYEVLFTPEGSQLVTVHHGPHDGVSVWNAETGELQRRFSGAHSSIKAAALSPDGQTLATGHEAVNVRQRRWDDPENAVIRLWNLESGQEIGRLIGHTGGIQSLDFSSDSRRLVSCSGGQFLNDAFNPDPSRDNTLRVWDVPTRRELARQSLGRHGQRAIFAPDGATIASSAGEVGEEPLVQIWRLPENALLTDRESDPIVVAVFARGQYLLDGREVDTALALAERLKFLLEEDPGREVIVELPKQLGVKAARELVALARQCGAARVRWPEWVPPEDRTLPGESASRKPATSGAESRRFEGSHLQPVTSVAVSADGRYLLSGSYDKTVRLWEIATGNELRPFLGHAKAVGDVAFSHDGQRALSGGSEGAIRVWDVESGDLRRELTGHTGMVRAVAFSPDDRLIVSGSADYGEGYGTDQRDNTLRLWDAETGRELRRFEGVSQAVSDVTFSSDGRFVLAAGEWKLIGLWDVETGKLARQFPIPETQPLCIALAPDGRTIATGHVAHAPAPGEKYNDAGHSVVCLWDVAAGRLIRKLRGHRGPVNSVAFSPSGEFILSGSGGHHFNQGYAAAEDNTLRLWDVTTGAELWRADAGNCINSVAFLPDGEQVFSGGGELEIGGGDNKPDLRLWTLPDLWRQPTPQDPQ